MARRSRSAPGGHYAFRDAQHLPVPVQAHLPIMIGGSGEKKTLRTVARYADMWNGMGSLERMTHKIEVLRGHCDAVGRDIAEIEFTFGLKVTIRDTKAEADRVWAAAMAHNRTPMADVADDQTFWNGTPEEIADRMRPYVELGFRTFISEHPAPYDTESLERLIGEVVPLLGCSAARQPATASRIARASTAVGSRGELRMAASSRVSVTSRSMAASSARPRPRRLGRWSTSRSSLSIAPIATAAAVDSDSALDATPSAIPTSASSRSRRAEVEAQDLREDGRQRRAVGDGPARPDRVAQRVDEADTRAAGLPDTCQVRGHQHLGSRLDVRAVRDRAPQPRADGPDDAERHRLGERVGVGREQRFERVGHRVDAGLVRAPVRYRLLAYDEAYGLLPVRRRAHHDQCGCLGR